MQVDESNEKWSEFKLEVAKVTITSAVRVDNQFDALGNPMYMTNVTPVLSIVSVPGEFHRKVQ